MSTLRTFSRIIVGLVFIFSGFVKAVDPLGSAYKFHDYFQAFHLGFLDFLTLPLAILLCTVEFIAGVAVLSGIRQKTGTWLVMIMMIGFTPLTLVLAINNPVSDCGCFGDAITLTNWQTFGKNVILILFSTILFLGRKDISGKYKSVTEWIIISCCSVLFILFNFWNIIYLPVIDFMPYKVGVNIASQTVIPPDAPPDIYETTFIYEKDGVQKEFTLNNYPADDTTWKFVDQKSILIKKGYEPPIHDFSLNSVTEGDITDKILSNKGYTLLMVSRKLEETDINKLSSGFETGNYCHENGITFYVLSASVFSEIEKYNSEVQFCTADDTMLKSMVRSNPGYVLLKDGTILGKWSWANVPNKEWFVEHYSERITD